MINLSPKERRTTAIVHLTFSIIGTFCSVYLFQATLTLYSRASSNGIDVAIFLAGGSLVAVLVLISWFGVFCLLYRYANSIRLINDRIEIDTGNGKINVCSKRIRFILETGKINIWGKNDDVKFVLVYGANRFILSPKENADKFFDKQK